MDYHPKVSLEIEGHVFSYKLFETLKIVSKTWSQRKASKILGISHAVLNRRIREAEEKLGFKLVVTTGAGSGLTEEAIKILQKYENYTNRVKEREKIVICGGYVSSNLMEIMSAEYGLNSVIYKTSDKEALYLASLDMVDILTFDDPVHAFIHNLDFIPIAYDYLVLFSGERVAINDINDLNGKNFVEVVDSPQRLAWNTLDDNKIRYKITEEFKSPYEALKFIKNNSDRDTFLSNSLVEGSDILKIDTRHILSSVICNREDKEIKNFLDFILSYRGQKIVESSGFESINK